MSRQNSLLWLLRRLVVEEDYHCKHFDPFYHNTILWLSHWLAESDALTFVQFSVLSESDSDTITKHGTKNVWKQRLSDYRLRLFSTRSPGPEHAARAVESPAERLHFEMVSHNCSAIENDFVVPKHQFWSSTKIVWSSSFAIGSSILVGNFQAENFRVLLVRKRGRERERVPAVCSTDSTDSVAPGTRLESCHAITGLHHSMIGTL